MDLREFIVKVKELGELKEIEGANWDLEIGAITYLEAEKPNPPAILFDKIQGYKPGYRLLVSPCSTEKRVNLVLGLPLDLKGLELVKNIKNKLNEPIRLISPMYIKQSPIMQNILQGNEVDLFMFPAPKWQAL
ncbi:MAG TPA: UbiD family decarboxylase, partial [candidate division Zixibacteria bacterium]